MHLGYRGKHSRPTAWGYVLVVPCYACVALVDLCKAHLDVFAMAGFLIFMGGTIAWEMLTPMARGVVIASGVFSLCCALFGTSTSHSATITPECCGDGDCREDCARCSEIVATA
jgi:predicted benzoate:H+ symporter BenE